MKFYNFNFQKNEANFQKANLILLILVFVLYFCNLLFLNQLNSFFSFYFNDLLATVLLFSFLNLIFPIKLNNFWIILLITIVASFMWEFVALFVKKGSVFDYFDILSYFISMGLYLLFIKVYEKYFTFN